MQQGAISLDEDLERQELRHLRSAIAASGDIIYGWDLESDGLTWWGQVSDLFGMAGAATVRNGAEFEHLIHPDDRLKRRDIRDRHVLEGIPYDCEYRLRMDSGEYCWVHDRGCAELSARGKPVRFTGILRIVTARKQAEASQDENISYDDLTGHYNRVRLRDSLEHALAYCTRYQGVGAYLNVGVDNLTQINDAYGYECADAVIVGVGQLLDRWLRASDVIGRMEGDRFGVVLWHCPEENIAKVAEKILNAIRAMPVDTPRGPMQITVSIGGVPFPAVPGQTAHDIMRSSEIALQDAKQEGRNCFVPYYYSDDQRRERQKEMAIAAKVQDALKEGRLVFAYQPVVRSDTRQTEFYECLLRMMDAKGDVIPAAEFIPVVERMGLIRTIDHRVLDMAVEVLTSDRDIVLSINVSGFTASDRSWLRLLISRLKGRPKVARRLIIEITETVALHDIEETASFVATVRGLGCRVALDDFGAGFTSFRHLQTLAVDMVKIDGSFIRNLDNNIDNQLFVKTLLGLAQGFGLQTVAESVETQDELDFLSHQGVHLLQGYYFGKPALEPERRSKPERLQQRSCAPQTVGLNTSAA